MPFDDFDDDSGVIKTIVGAGCLVLLINIVFWLALAGGVFLLAKWIFGL